MNLPDHENTSLDPGGPEEHASSEERPRDEIGGESGYVLYKDNLIYLPFARHLAEEDEATLKKAA